MKEEGKRAVFLGSKEFGLHIFKVLFDASVCTKWLLVCPEDTADPRSARAEFVKYAMDNKIGLQFTNSASLTESLLEKFRPDIVFVCGYYRILQEGVLDSVPQGVWGIHNSLLPKYRGGSPLVWQMINGEKKLGSSLFRFGKGVDDGPVLHQITIPFTDKMTISEASDEIEASWLKILPTIWEVLERGCTTEKPQNNLEATYCAQRTEADGKINWSKSSLELDRFIRAQAAPYPKAFFFLGEDPFRGVKHEFDYRTVYGSPGQIFEVKDDFISVVCGRFTLLRLYELEVREENVLASTVIRSIKIRLQ